MRCSVLAITKQQSGSQGEIIEGAAIFLGFEIPNCKAAEIRKDTGSSPLSGIITSAVRWNSVYYKISTTVSLPGVKLRINSFAGLARVTNEFGYHLRSTLYRRDRNCQVLQDFEG